MMFSPGQRVRCISDDFSTAYATIGASIPSLGAVYTVRDVREYPFVAGVVWVFLSEILNPLVQFQQGKFEPPFLAKHFRPLSDISVFTALLNIQKVTESA